MQEKHLFEYAVIRVVPKVERGEFINIGVVLYCARLKFLQASFNLDESKLAVLASDFDAAELKQYMTAFEQVCVGGNGGGPIGVLPIAERFRWLTATRSTVIQSSSVHTGLCIDAAEMLAQLYQQLVL